MDPLLKDLIAGIRDRIPDWATTSNIEIVLRAPANTTVTISMVGIPPADETTIWYNGKNGEIIKNWGSVEVNALIDSPSNILERQAVLKDYDNRRGPPKKNKEK